MTEPAATIGETVMLPEYAVEIAELLAETEGHADVTVRAVRKMVVQGAVALRALIQPSTGRSVDATPELQPAEEVRARAEAQAPKAPRSAPESLRLMREHGVTAAQVRLWARGQGRDVPGRGQLSTDLVQAYLDHALTRASPITAE